MIKHKVLNLASPTTNDDEFYVRWSKIGDVYPTADDKDWNKFTVLVVDHRVNVTDSILDKMPKLRVIASANTGHTHIKCDLSKRNIELITLRGETNFLSQIRSVSEFTIFLMLYASRPTNQVGYLLRDKKLGIVGMGRIGKQVKELALGFGMKVDYVDKQHKDTDWERLFIESDYISVHLEENDSTKGIISRDLLSKMPDDSILINTARGSVVDELALADMLNSGSIMSAAVDHVDNHKALNEGTRNLIITGHMAGNTLEDRIRTDSFILKKTMEYLNMSTLH